MGVASPRTGSTSPGPSTISPFTASFPSRRAQAEGKKKSCIAAPKTAPHLNKYRRPSPHSRYSTCSSIDLTRRFCANFVFGISASFAHTITPTRSSTTPTLSYHDSTLYNPHTHLNPPSRTQKLAAMFRIATRLPFRAARTPFVRYNSSTTGASRIVQLAGQVERPSAMEASVPVMWAVCGALVFTAFNRVEERAGSENVETLLIV